MRFQKLLIILLIFGFLAMIYYGNRWLQAIVQPRRSFGRLMAYLLICFAAAFAFSFLLVLVITKLFPVAKG